MSTILMCVKDTRTETYIAGKLVDTYHQCRAGKIYTQVDQTQCSCCRTVFITVAEVPAITHLQTVCGECTGAHLPGIEAWQLRSSFRPLNDPEFKETEDLYETPLTVAGLMLE
jgi:hypothetical protein